MKDSCEHWSERGAVPLPNALRNCAKWSREEVYDLLIRVAHGTTMEELMRIHQRTRSGMAARLREMLRHSRTVQACTQNSWDFPDSLLLEYCVQTHARKVAEAWRPTHRQGEEKQGAAAVLLKTLY